MAQPNGQGVADDDVRHLVDQVIRVLVVLLLVSGWVAWLERSPLPALGVGIVVAVLVRAWHQVPWATDARAAAANRVAGLDDLDLMTSREFQDLIVRLLRRDAFVDVRALGVRDDLSTDVLARTPGGHRVLVECKRDDRHRRVGAHEVGRFAAAVQDDAELAVLVTTGRFTRSARALGERRDVILLDRSQVAAWITGRPTPLSRLRPQDRL